MADVQDAANSVAVARGLVERSEENWLAGETPGCKMHARRQCFAEARTRAVARQSDTYSGCLVAEAHLQETRGGRRGRQVSGGVS